MISVVIPSFNQGLWLEQAIASVLEQGYPAEAVVMDGGSSDGSREILARWSSRLAYWQSRPDCGQTAAVNAGIARTRGAIMGWINSDDYYLPGAFAGVARRFAAADRPDVVFGYSLNVDAGGTVLRENRHDDFSFAALVKLGLDLRHQAMFWRAELNPQIFPLDEELRFCMDLQLVLRLASSGARFARLPDYLGAFRIHGGAKTATIPEVGRREHAALVGAAAGELAVLRPGERAAAWLARRLRFCRRGEWEYGLLGGRHRLPSAARAAAVAAQRWSTARHRPSEP